MPTDMLTKPEKRLVPVAVPVEDGEFGTAKERQARRVRNLKINVTAWSVGTIVLTAAWVAHEWQANGAFERFAHEGNSGDWNPTLWALVVLVWGLVVGIMALRVHFERPATTTEVDREIERLAEGGPMEAGVRRRARARLDHIRRLRFHGAAWLLGMIVLMPVNVLIEWQDNGRFERISTNSHPGSWDPWMLYVGGIWAAVIAVFIALPVYLERRKT